MDIFITGKTKVLLAYALFSKTSGVLLTYTLYFHYWKDKSVIDLHSLLKDNLGVIDLHL